MKRYTVVLLAMLAILQTSQAEVTIYNPAAKLAWIQAAGDYEFIDFTGFSHHTLITNQYNDRGVEFLDNTSFITSDSSMPDGWGLYGETNFPPGFIRMRFHAPMTAIAAEFLGSIQFELKRDGQVIYTSFAMGPGGGPHFYGLISTEPFDEVRLFRANGNQVPIDNLYFGPAIPGPWSLALFAAAAVVPPRRRRV